VRIRSDSSSTLLTLSHFITNNSKLDLLAKVRYQNPLPAPPCPPKLLDIPTNPKRYTRPEFLDAATNEALLPMVVDAECGMPLDLGKWEALWEDGADDSGARMSSPSPSDTLLIWFFFFGF
jgi:RNA polymerase II-associated factor 1